MQAGCAHLLRPTLAQDTGTCPQCQGVKCRGSSLSPPSLKKPLKPGGFSPGLTAHKPHSAGAFFLLGSQDPSPACVPNTQLQSAHRLRKETEVGMDKPDPRVGAETPSCTLGESDGSRRVPALCPSCSPAYQFLAQQSQALSPGSRISSALSSYHEPPQYQHRSPSPHRQYFDFWNPSYLARDSKYIPDNFLSSFLIISFSLKFIFENMYWDDGLFITADGQYSSHLCPTPHNTHTHIPYSTPASI